MCAEKIDFPFLRLLFTCRVSGPLLYFTSRRGETIKGLIAGEMKKLFPCPVSASCDRCKWADDPGQCVYVRFFQNNLTKSPFAYTIIPPLNHRSAYYRNETFSFEIRLFGDCARFDYVLKYLTTAIEQGGLLSGIGTWYKEEEQHFGRFQLNGIHAWQNNGWEKIFQEESGFIADGIDVQSFADQFTGQLAGDGHPSHQVYFYTPFCLKKSGKIIDEPTLPDIVYFSIMRLKAITGGRTIRIDDDVYGRLGSIAPAASQFEKTFSAKNMSYYIGSMGFEQFPPEVIPILKVGSFCHIGKGITQGYGGYFLVP